ncbi:NTP transferase domain-containing protein [bacterium]|nr:NTP transferase domain-containing protein [bacterium]
MAPQNETEKTAVDVLVLAAGKSTRMGGTLPKVLQPLGRKKVIDYVLERVQAMPFARIGVVVGFQAERVREYLVGRNLIFIEQKEQLGTGHAVMVSEPVFSSGAGHLLVLSGDVPLLTRHTLEALLTLHLSTDSPATMLSTHLVEPFGYGRIVRTELDRVNRIIEEKDTTIEEKKINEINAGIYVFRKTVLFEALHHLTNDNRAREYYLTDVIGVLVKHNFEPHIFCTEDFREVLGINTPEELKQVELCLNDLNRCS